MTDIDALRRELERIDAEIEDTESRMPAHSVKPPIMHALFDLERVREWPVVTGQCQRRAHDRFAEFLEHNGPVLVGDAGFDVVGRGHRRQQFARALTSKLLSYALGRSLELTDQPTVDELTAKFAEADYRIADLVQFVMASEPFQSK